MICAELCMKKQRRLASTIKRARHMGKSGVVLLPPVLSAMCLCIPGFMPYTHTQEEYLSDAKLY